jgi:hypothetical protein
MRQVAATVWTSRRKWLGNLIPALFWLPPALAGLFQLLTKGQFIGTGLWLLILSTILGWLAVNQFGFFENGAMRRQLERILMAEERKLSSDSFFVGFASPTYSSMLDAHEDVGFLSVQADSLKFISESRTIEIFKSDVTEIRFRANVHSVIFLGRWISVEAKTGGKPIRLLIEPREKSTLLGNRIFGSKLLAHLRKWKGLVK